MEMKKYHENKIKELVKERSPDLTRNDLLIIWSKTDYRLGIVSFEGDISFRKDIKGRHPTKEMVDEQINYVNRFIDLTINQRRRNHE